MVGRSVLGVEGLSRPDQIHLHPSGADQDTYLRFDVDDCHYDMLQIGYGLADQVAGLSNGVRYTLQASADGGSSYTVLCDETVTDSVWNSKTVPLTLYWGEDVAFQLVVDALGDDAYDWLQTTVRLFPVRDMWDLAGNLAAVQVAAPDGPLSWNGSSAWVDGDGRPLVAISQAPVQGARRDNQIQFHPYGSQQATSVTLVVEDNPYSTLRTRYALADEAIGRSDGVDFVIKACTNGGRTCATLLEEQVLRNVWNTALLDLNAYTDQDLTVELVSSSRGDETYDWLQITLDLFVAQRVVQDRGEID
jgi:hypothetical protein